MPKQVFLSYSTDDTTAATAVRDYLERQSIACWMAPGNITPGKDYGEQILDAIEEATVLVLILSESSNHSVFVRNEVERAVAKGKVVIPYRIQPVQPSRSLEFFISNYQWIDGWELPLAKTMEALIHAILNHLDGRATHSLVAVPPSHLLTPSPLDNLPHQLTPFVGRETELAALDRLLSQPDVRLVTILGPGGMGKTRLSLAVAERHLADPRFAHGVYFIALAPLSDTQHILLTLAEALSFMFQASNEARSPQQQLLDYLRAKSTLLVFDNFEHVLDGADLVAQILRMAPQAQVLATSRERLRVPGEHLFPIQGLDYDKAGQYGDEAGSAAVRLFMQSARQIVPELELTAKELAQVTDICRLVDGMPLGIELAASWMELLSPAEIVAEIQRSLDFLETEQRGGAEQHRSVRAVFDSTWRRLDQAEQDMFARLTIFRGGFTREAAEQVAGASLRHLGALAGKSLIQHERESGRYMLHELLRQYGADKLAQDAAAQEGAHTRHIIYFVTLLHAREADLKGGRQKEAVAEIEVERENVHLAWQYAVAQGQASSLIWAMESMGLFNKWQGRYLEGRAAFHIVVASLADTTSPTTITTDTQRALAKALAWQSVFARLVGDVDSAMELLQHSQTLLDGHLLTCQEAVSDRAFVLHQLGNLDLDRNNADARASYEQSLTLYRTLGARWEMAGVLTSLGEVAQYLGDYAEMQARYQESLDLYRALGDELGTAAALEMLSRNARFSGRADESERLAWEGYRLCQKIGNPSSLAKGLFSLAQAIDWAGRHAEAQALMQESIELHSELGDLPALSHLHSRLGMSQLALGQFEAAKESAYKGLAIASQIDSVRCMAFAYEMLGRAAIIDNRYDDAQNYAQEAIATYHKCGVRAEEGRAFALLAHVFWRKGDMASTQRPLVQALETGLELPDISTLTAAMEVVALLLIGRGDWQAAVEIHALVQGWRLRVMPHWHEDIVGRYLTESNPDLSPVADTAAHTHAEALSFPALCQISAVWLERVGDLTA